MLPSKRDKSTGHIYKLSKKLEDYIDRQYDAEQQQTTLKLECASDDEQEYEIFTTTDEAFLTSLNMTCSNSEDAFEASADGGSVSRTTHTNELAETTAMANAVELQNICSMKESTPTTVMSMFRSMSKQIASMHKKIDSVQKEVANNSDRLGQLERKIGVSLRTVENMKDAIVLLDKASGDSVNQEMQDNVSDFEFKIITNEEEFTEFDSKLGTDAEYYSLVKNAIRMKIVDAEPDNRMHQAIDMILDRSFMPLCSWSGHGVSGPKIDFGKRTNILKLFADIGSTRFTKVDQLSVENFFRNKLRHAKQRVNLQGNRKTGCRKRKIVTSTSEQLQ